MRPPFHEHPPRWRVLATRLALTAATLAVLVAALQHAPSGP